MWVLDQFGNCGKIFRWHFATFGFFPPKGNNRNYFHQRGSWSLSKNCEDRSHWSISRGGDRSVAPPKMAAADEEHHWNRLWHQRLNELDVSTKTTKVSISIPLQSLQLFLSSPETNSDSFLGWRHLVCCSDWLSRGPDMHFLFPPLEQIEGFDSLMCYVCWMHMCIHLCHLVQNKSLYSPKGEDKDHFFIHHLPLSLVMGCSCAEGDQSNIRVQPGRVKGSSQGHMKHTPPFTLTPTGNFRVRSEP